MARLRPPNIFPVLVVTTIVYLRSLANGFVSDDTELIATNRLIGQWSYFWKSLTRDLWWCYSPLHLPVGNYYRPLVNEWFGLNYHLFGLRTAGWHAALIGLHLLVVYLVYKAAIELAGEPQIAFVASLLFGVLPIHAEVVAWEAAVCYLLGSAFSLGVFLLFANRRAAPARNLLVALVLYAGAVFSHESFMIVVVLLGAYIWLFEPRTNAEGRFNWGLLWLGLLGVEIVLYGIERIRVIGSFDVSNGFNPMTREQMLLTAPSVLAADAALLVVPTLAGPAHVRPAVISAASPHFYLPLIFLIAVVAGFLLVIRNHPRRKLYLFCGAWIAICLAPTMNLRAFFPDMLMTDRYLYFPSVGLCIMAGDWVVHFVRDHAAARRWAMAGVAGFVIVCSVELWRVERFWHDDATLYAPYAEHFPERSIFREKLGLALYHQGDLEGAQRELQIYVELRRRGR